MSCLLGGHISSEQHKVKEKDMHNVFSACNVQPLLRSLSLYQNKKCNFTQLPVRRKTSLVNSVTAVTCIMVTSVITSMHNNIII